MSQRSIYHKRHLSQGGSLPASRVFGNGKTRVCVVDPRTGELHFGKGIANTSVPCTEPMKQEKRERILAAVGRK